MDPSLIAEPVMSIWPMIIAAVAGLAGQAMQASKTDAPVAPGAAGNQMDFGQNAPTAEETFKRETPEATPWMQTVGGNASPTGFGLNIQQPTNQAITMEEMFG